MSWQSNLAKLTMQNGWQTLHSVLFNYCLIRRCSLTIQTCTETEAQEVLKNGSWKFRCCDRKSRAAYAQSFALWQQATIEFTCDDHSSRTLLLRSLVDIVSITRDYTPRSLFYCLFAPHIWMVLFFTHIPFVVNHTFNTTPSEGWQQSTPTENPLRGCPRSRWRDYITDLAWSYLGVDPRKLRLLLIVRHIRSS